ncbi:hypothetical protein [Flavobacterium sedimenticola]|uniref:Uncharacterized protein n=1 Tax=Flavobacterium sedimenticola TaxID=3043286 RepID=A0ABT6XP52_9FLAO|nr:hypothetical protein [Flavobacterium sedimenticola]MDI9256868.1 hypothetical protein [Flavobacterium sedimenticola]
MKPNFPIIIIYNDALDLIPAEENLYQASLLGVLNGNSNSKAYDNEGNIWELKLISEKVKDNFFTRLLANTVYNPKINVTPEWKLLEKYKLVELKSFIKKLIENDNDFYTQFVDEKILNEHIENAKSLKEVYEILLKNVFEFEAE